MRIYARSGYGSEHEPVNNTTVNEDIIIGTSTIDAANETNAISSTTGVTASATDDFKVLLHDADGDDITIQNKSASLANLDVYAVKRDGVTTLQLGDRLGRALWQQRYEGCGHAAVDLRRILYCHPIWHGHSGLFGYRHSYAKCDLKYGFEYVDQSGTCDRVDRLCVESGCRNSGYDGS